jgi:hypothetical protein
VPRYLVTTQRALRGRVPSAQEAVRDAAGVTVVDAGNPEMVTIEASEEAAAELKRKLAATHFVDPETHHQLH